MTSQKISIIVPVYNTAKYLEQCVDSILQQRYTDVEVILIDDGSTDGCPAICDRYAQQDKRVKVIHQPNAGVAVARNQGLDNVTGEYVSFVDSDDYLHPDMYAELYEAITRNNADLAMFHNIVFAPESDYNVLPIDLLPIPLQLTGFYPAKDFWQEYLDTEPPCTSLVIGKLCQRKQLENRRFDINTSYPETLFLAQWYLACNTVLVCSGEDRYYHRQRPDGEHTKRFMQISTQTICNFIDLQINKVNLFYDHGLTDVAYSSDRFTIQKILRYFESLLVWEDSSERLKWMPELEKRWNWFNAQEWKIHNGKTYLTRNVRDL
ncbi:MAG: glycosyltransferase [Planctomycetaceae bacterium]|nr:glycosyltransferase [Planctomycetaceae bacterium]